MGGVGVFAKRAWKTFLCAWRVGLRSRATGVARLCKPTFADFAPHPFRLRVHWTCDAGRAGAQLPSEALDRTSASDAQRRIARERVPTADTPIRRHADTFPPNADPPIRRHAPPRVSRDFGRTSRILWNVRGLSHTFVHLQGYDHPGTLERLYGRQKSAPLLFKSASTLGDRSGIR